MMASTTETQRVTADRLRELLYRHAPGNYTFRGLHFTPGALFRLGCIVGQATDTMLDDIARQLSYLADYGGNAEHESGATYPACKVSISDDGCLHSFGLAWYQAIDCEGIHAQLEAAGIENADGKAFREYVDRHCLPDSHEWRSYRNAWDREGEPNSGRLLIYYRRWFIGGLIYHWGDDERAGAWSVHT